MKKYLLGYSTKDVEGMIKRIKGNKNATASDKKKLKLLEDMGKLQADRNKLMKKYYHGKITPKGKDRGNITKKVTYESTRENRWDLSGEIAKLRVKLGGDKKGAESYSQKIQKNRVETLKKPAKKAKKLKEVAKKKTASDKAKSKKRSDKYKKDKAKKAKK